MSTTVLYGKPVVEQINNQLLDFTQRISRNLVIATVGLQGNSEWLQYTNSLARSAGSYGCVVDNTLLDANCSLEDLTDCIDKLNKDNSIDGIILQQPLPHALKCAVDSIDYHKDIDGLTQRNSYDLYCGRETIVPATAMAVIKMLEYYNIALAGKTVTVVGRGLAVGKPLALMLINRNATVTVCHSKTKDVASICQDKDIVISACGVAKYVTHSFVNTNSVVIDVGLNFVDGKTCGDVDFESVSQVASCVSPVPGGIGPITRACLFYNTMLAVNNRG